MPEISTGFADDKVATATSAGVVAAHHREESELQAMFTVSNSLGRSELDGYNRAMSSCERPAFADGTTYNFPRGGKTISGPSVKLARELARVWGRIAFDLRVVDINDDQVHIRAVALDLVHVTRIAMEDKFSKKIQRKRNGQTLWVEPDERDLRELINRRGAILVRNCLLQVLPPDLVEDAVAKAKATLVDAASGDLQKNRADVVKAVIASFDKVGVKQVQLEEHIGSPMAKMTPTQCQDLRGIYQSLVDGHTEPLDHFHGIAGQQHSADVLNDELEARREAREGAAQDTASTDSAQRSAERLEASGRSATAESVQSAGTDTAINDVGSTEEQPDATTYQGLSGSSGDEDRALEAVSDAPVSSQALDNVRALEDKLGLQPKSKTCRDLRLQHLGVTQLRKSSAEKVAAYVVHLTQLTAAHLPQKEANSGDDLNF